MWRLWDRTLGMLAFVGRDEQTVRALLSLGDADVVADMVVLGPDDPNPDGSKVPENVLDDDAPWAFSAQYLEELISMLATHLLKDDDLDGSLN